MAIARRAWAQKLYFIAGAVAGGVYYAATASTGLSWGQFAQGALSTAGEWGREGVRRRVRAGPSLERWRAAERSVVP